MPGVVEGPLCSNLGRMPLHRAWETGVQGRDGWEFDHTLDTPSEKGNETQIEEYGGVFGGLGLFIRPGFAR